LDYLRDRGGKRDGTFKAAIPVSGQIVVTKFNREGSVDLSGSSAHYDRSSRLVHFEHLQPSTAREFRDPFQFFRRGAVSIRKIFVGEPFPL
jgi:hypothetical protein